MLLATCARNIWLITSMYNIGLEVSHIPGVINVVALLSRWQSTEQNIAKEVILKIHGLSEFFFSFFKIFLLYTNDVSHPGGY